MPGDAAERLARRAAGRARGDARSGSARAIRCGWRPGSASMATTSTRPPRRSRRIWPGRSPSAGARKAGFPAPRVIARAACGGPPRAARRHLSPEGRAPAREGTRDHRRRRHARSATSPAAASAPRLDGPIAMGYVAAAHAALGTRAGADGARHAAPGAHRAAAFRSPPLSPLSRSQRGCHEHRRLHQGP